MEKKQASILAIGNELLLGQIINKNAALISERLLDYNIRVINHYTVADNLDEIVNALHLLWKKSDIIFVIGGLGPTEDDLTREAVSKFLAVPIHQDDHALKDLKIKLEKRNVAFTLNHIKQSQFPSGSYRMKNDVGTADGFFFERKSKHLYAVPGPWAEVEACWKSFIHHSLTKSFADLEKIQLERFQILGLPESEISNKVQALLKGSPFSAEYKIHLPYVEVRVDVDQKAKEDWPLYESKIIDAFAENLACRGQEDLAASFISKLENKKVLIVDAVSNGYIFTRLLPFIKGKPIDLYQIQSLPAAFAGQNYDIYFQVHAKNENEWEISIGESQKISINRLGSRPLRRDLLIKKMSELFFWKMTSVL